MTSKKENILNAALELFALEGYYATSTSAIAKKAGVSEGLIFRHFKNKEGLLEAIFQMGEEQVKVIFADIVLVSIKTYRLSFANNWTLVKLFPA